MYGRVARFLSDVDGDPRMRTGLSISQPARLFDCIKHQSPLTQGPSNCVREQLFIIIPVEVVRIASNTGREVSS